MRFEVFFARGARLEIGMLPQSILKTHGGREPSSTQSLGEATILAHA
ncbi:MAG: hypothetical protein QM817_38695 [Archangium sp.]